MVGVVDEQAHAERPAPSQPGGDSVDVDPAGHAVEPGGARDPAEEVGGRTVCSRARHQHIDTTGGEGVLSHRLGQQHGLAEARSGRHDDSPYVPARCQQLDQSQAGDQTACHPLARDSSFSDDGLVTTDFADAIGPASTDDFGADLALQPDGKIVVVGRGASDGSGDDLAMTRYGTDGTLDASFGPNGTLTVDFAGGFDFGHDVAIQPDSKIVASATATNGSNTELGLVRIDN